MKVKELFKISKGKKSAELEFDSGLRYIQIEDLRTDQNLKYADPDTKTVTCSKSDILIAWDGANAGTIGYGLEGAIGSTIAKLSPINGNIDSEYAGRFLQSKFNYLRDTATGATIPHISRSVLESLDIPLPPLPVQKRIAEILDLADAYRQKTKALIDKYDELAQSIFLEMFGDTWLNPNNLPVARISDLASPEKYSIKAGPFGSALKKEFYVEKGYKIYGQEQVIRDDLSYGDYYIDEQKYQELKSCTVQSGDIMISLVGTYGKISIVPEQYEPGIINPRLMKITPNIELVMPHFLKILLQSQGVEVQLKNFSRGGTMDIVNVGIIKELKVPVPPLHDQKSFLREFENIKTQKRIVEDSILKSEDLFNSLLQRAFKGELVKSDHVESELEKISHA
jgi:type I restriction enzyme S subunit